MKLSSQYDIILQKIDSDYIFIDLPYYSNIGDTLIWEGTEELLKNIKFKCLLRASYETFQFPELTEETIILMMGGGNWGDLYLPHNDLRKKVVQEYPNNKIIILPQTVYYEGAYNARWDAHIFRQHKNLIICARDKYSYRILKAYGFCRNVMLVPDMAFCINKNKLNKYTKQQLHKDLLFKRIDKEESDEDLINTLSEKYDVSDWPFYIEFDPLFEKLKSLINEGRCNEADEYAVNTYLPNRVKVGVEFISQYDRVFSNRLHGTILSILLDKEVYIFDNSYGKNSQYYNAWLKEAKNVHLLTTSQNFNFKRKVHFFYWWLRSIVDRIIGLSR